MTTIRNKELHAWRDRQNLTQEQAANMLGISRQYYGQIERLDVYSRTVELAAAAIEYGIRLPEVPA